MNGIIKIAQSRRETNTLFDRVRTKVNNPKPEGFGPLSEDFLGEYTRIDPMRSGITRRGVRVEVIGTGVNKSKQPSVSTNKQFQEQKYG